MGTRSQRIKRCCEYFSTHRVPGCAVHPSLSRVLHIHFPCAGFALLYWLTAARGCQPAGWSDGSRQKM
jgi:hypothetical protein